MVRTPRRIRSHLSNRDGLIDEREAWRAFGVFGNVLQAYLKTLDPALDSPAKAEALFMYLLAKGRTPSRGFLGTVAFGEWLLIWPYLHFEADRGRVLRIFAALGSNG